MQELSALEPLTLTAQQPPLTDGCLKTAGITLFVPPCATDVPYGQGSIEREPAMVEGNQLSKWMAEEKQSENSTTVTRARRLTYRAIKSRSEERRVGKACRAQWWQKDQDKHTNKNKRD